MKRLLFLVILFVAGCVATGDLEQRVSKLERQALMGAAQQAGANFYPSSGGWTGGGAGALDKITGVAEGDTVLVTREDDSVWGDAFAVYVADDSACSDDYPLAVDPDEAGTLCWRYAGLIHNNVTTILAGDFKDGAVPPALATHNHVSYYAFDSSTAETIQYFWRVPEEFYEMDTDEVQFRVVGMQTAAASAPTLTFGDRSGDTGGVADTWIWGGNVNNNYDGSSMYCTDKAGEYVSKILLDFDITAIPTNATVTAVSIKLNLKTNTYAPGDSSGIDLYNEVNAFVENQATWNVYATGISWTGTHGQGSKLDDGPDEGNFTDASATGAYYTWSSASLISDVQSNIGGHARYILIPDTQTTYSLQFYDTAEANDSVEPYMSVTYTLPGSPADGQGVTFDIDACIVDADSETVDCTVSGSPVSSENTDMDEELNAQWDIVWLPWVTKAVTDIDAGDWMKVTVTRDVADSDDDYASDMGFLALEVKYHAKTKVEGNFD